MRAGRGATKAEEAKQRAQPYNKIVGELPEMRRDTINLIRRATGEGLSAFVIVNNRSEGNAPLTIQGLITGLRGCESNHN